MLEGKDWSSSVMFSDGENLGMITAGKDVIIAIVYIHYCCALYYSLRDLYN